VCKSLRLTVFIPVRDMAEITIKRLSTYNTERLGVDRRYQTGEEVINPMECNEVAIFDRIRKASV
jgi:hypothetical protein